jgi:hypothetical protein
LDGCRGHVEISGGIDIFPDRSNQGAAKDRIVTPDEVVPREHLIIASWCGKNFRPDRVVTRAGFDRTPAVQRQDLYEIKSSSTLQPGPAALTDGTLSLLRLELLFMPQHALRCGAEDLETSSEVQRGNLSSLPPGTDASNPPPSSGEFTVSLPRTVFEPPGGGDASDPCR